MSAPECTCLPLVTCDRCEREALAANQRVGMVTHRPVPSEDVGPDGPYSRDMCSCGEMYHDVHAPELTPAEAATVAGFDAAPDAEESLRERVARAMWAAVMDDTSWEMLSASSHDRWRTASEAAIAVMRGDDV